MYLLIVLIHLFDIIISDPDLSSKMVINRNCIYKGNDVSTNEAATARDCGIMCLNHSSCTHFTWMPGSYSNESLCHMKWLLERVAKESFIENEGTACGLIIGKFKKLPTSVIIENCVFAGAHIRIHVAGTVEDCTTLCSNNKPCNHFTYLPSGSSCLMMSSRNINDAQKSSHSFVGSKCGLMVSKFKTDHSCEYKGDDILKATTESSSKCRRLCENHDRCDHFTWLFDKTCSLKHAANLDQLRASRIENLEAICGFIAGKLIKNIKPRSVEFFAVRGK